MAFSSFPPTVLTVSGSRVRAKSPISAGSARHPEDVFACAEAIVANSSKNVKKEKSEGEIVIGRAPWLPLWGSWLPRKGQTERASMADFCCHYLTAAPSQSAGSADSSPKGRAKGCCRICPPNYNLARKQRKIKNAAGNQQRILYATEIRRPALPCWNGGIWYKRTHGREFHSRLPSLA